MKVFETEMERETNGVQVQVSPQTDTGSSSTQRPIKTTLPIGSLQL